MASSGQKKVEVLGITLIVLIFIHTVLQIFLVQRAPLDPSVFRSMVFGALGRAVVIGGLCSFLLGGAPWARLLLGLFCALGAVLAVVRWCALTGAGGSMFSPLGLSVIALAAIYLGAVYLLYFDRDVIRHFDRSA